ncbi:peptidyl-Lys metalloendopeptidase [Pluteus cervinus]|uniref:Peptidyl-Lys metalloendopeptidase n=1 Tax=Pluteus cervinus TaxID=181527 RepID=A0ACD3AIT3_9AGAR|nr:peptidyl-Lys metalloendopeptidase [Pluteus cervinus]
MFSSLRAILFGLALGAASSVSALPSVALKLTGPDDVEHVADLKITATVTNTGDETLKLLKDPLSPLSTLPANTFRIEGTTGAVPAFVGIKAKYLPARAAKSQDPSVFTVLAPGQSVEVYHDLSQAYNFAPSGAGAYSFEARNTFYYVKDNGEVASLKADSEAQFTTLSGTLSVSPQIRKRVNYNSCSQSQQSEIAATIPGVVQYATGAYSYLEAHNASTTRYNSWFGAYSASNHDIVSSHFKNISSSDFNSFTFDCSCTEAGTYAYANLEHFGHITLCGMFWQVPTTGTDSKAGTIIHESSHFFENGYTEDYTYGQPHCRALAQNDPSKAVMNADSHEYFAENNPSES